MHCPVLQLMQTFLFMLLVSVSLPVASGWPCFRAIICITLIVCHISDETMNVLHSNKPFQILNLAWIYKAALIVGKQNPWKFCMVVYCNMRNVSSGDMNRYLGTLQMCIQMMCFPRQTKVIGYIDITFEMNNWNFWEVQNARVFFFQQCNLF